MSLLIILHKIGMLVHCVTLSYFLNILSSIDCFYMMAEPGPPAGKFEHSSTP